EQEDPSAAAPPPPPPPVEVIAPVMEPAPPVPEPPVVVPVVEPPPDPNAPPVVVVPDIRSTLRELLAAGDLAGAKTYLGEPPAFPNVLDPLTNTSVLANALAVAPTATIRDLVRSGARPDNSAADLLPSLVSLALGSRVDRLELAGLLI